MKKRSLSVACTFFVLVLLASCSPPRTEPNAFVPVKRDKKAPTGDLIVFTDNQALWTMDAEGKSVHQLVKGEGKISQPHWSPDKKQVAFLEGSNNVLTIFDLTTERKKPIMISVKEEMRAEEGAIAWRPDSKSIALNLYEGIEEGTIYHLDLESRARKPFWSQENDDTFETDPAFSPDGKRLVFSWNEVTASNPIQTQDLWRINADGSDLVKLFIAGAGKLTLGADWSAATNRIVFEVRRSDGYESTNSFYSDIHIINHDGTKHQLLVENGRSPAFSPDGKKVVFSRNNTLWVIGVGDPSPKQLGSGGYAVEPDW